MKVQAFAGKSLGALVILAVAWVNQTLSPLFWLLLALIAVDLILNIHQEGKQLQKLGSTFFALGLPAWISEHASAAAQLSPEFLKGVVVLLTLGYVWVVVPQVFAFVQRILPQPEQQMLQEMEPQALEAIVRKVIQEAKSTSPEAAQKAQEALGVEQAATPGSSGSDKEAS